MLNTIRNLYDEDVSAPLRGTDLYGREDEKLGSVDDAIVDSDSGDLRYLIANAGWLERRRFIIPADQVYAYSDTELYVNLSKKDAEALPEFREECLASEEAFANYESDYRTAWRNPGKTTGARPSQRLIQLQRRIKDTFAAERRKPAEQVGRAPMYGQASYSGAVVQPTGVYGVYSNRKDVEKAVGALKELGFASNDISVVFPNPDISKEFAIEKNTKAPEGALAGGGSGLVIGGTLGWLAGIGTIAIPGIGPLLAAGPIVAALAGAGVGGAIGGIAGALIGFGLPELEAKRYEAAIKQGRILVSIHCEDMRHAEKARKALDDTGAKEVFLSGEREAA